MHVPNNGYGFEQWYNVGVHQENSKTTFVVAQMTIIQWDEVVDGKTHQHFTPYLIETVSTGFDRKIYLESPRLSSQCRQCHTSGIHDVFNGDDPVSFESQPKPLVGERYQTRNGTFEVIDYDILKKRAKLRNIADSSVTIMRDSTLMRDRMNSSFRRYGSLDWRGDKERGLFGSAEKPWEGWYPVEKLGPPMQLDPEYIDMSSLGRALHMIPERGMFVAADEQYRIQQRDPEKWVNLADCSNCHDMGASRGILNLNLGPTGWKHLGDKLRDKSMPFKTPYPGRSSVLLQALKLGYTDQLIEWVNLRACL